MIHHGRWLCPGHTGKNQTLPYFPTYHTFTVPPQTPTAMSTDQRASDRVGELVHDVFEALLQANAALERIQDLIGLGMDLKQLLAPHSQATWNYMAPQQQRFNKNWEKFVSAMEGAAQSSVSHPQQAAVETVQPAPAPLPTITAQVTEEALPEIQSKVWSFLWLR
jgi:uncharacterized protein YoaH (UPF0181 family)